MFSRVVGVKCLRSAEALKRERLTRKTGTHFQVVSSDPSRTFGFSRSDTFFFPSSEVTYLSSCFSAILVSIYSSGIRNIRAAKDPECDTLNNAYGVALKQDGSSHIVYISCVITRIALKQDGIEPAVFRHAASPFQGFGKLRGHSLLEHKDGLKLTGGDWLRDVSRAKSMQVTNNIIKFQRSAEKELAPVLLAYRYVPP